jgi:transposase-like protein
MLERYAAGIHGTSPAEFAKAVQVTIALKTGIHALTNNQSLMIDETVLSVFKQLSENDTIIYTLLKGSPDKITEFKYAFRDCHERLQQLANS